MGIYDFRPYRSPHGGTTVIRQVPMNASETFLPGELIFVNSDGEAQTFPIDGTQSLLGETTVATGIQWGVALNGPGAASTAARPFWAMIDPNTGTTYATGAMINFVPADVDGQTFIGRALVAGGASGLSTAVPGSSRGIIYEVTYDASGTPDAGWGIELTAGVAATDVLGKVIDIFDTNWRRISATATNGVYIEFELRSSTNIS